MSSNHELSDGSIGFKIKKPFELLVQMASDINWYTKVVEFRTSCIKFQYAERENS